MIKTCLKCVRVEDEKHEIIKKGKIYRVIGTRIAEGRVIFNTMEMGEVLLKSQYHEFEVVEIEEEINND